MKHRIKTHHWKHGELEIKEFYSDNFTTAVEYANSMECDACKIYDESGAVVYVINADDMDFYA